MSIGNRWPLAVTSIATLLMHASHATDCSAPPHATSSPRDQQSKDYLVLEKWCEADLVFTMNVASRMTITQEDAWDVEETHHMHIVKVVHRMRGRPKSKEWLMTTAATCGSQSLQAGDAHLVIANRHPQTPTLLIADEVRSEEEGARARELARAAREQWGKRFCREEARSQRRAYLERVR